MPLSFNKSPVTGKELKYLEQVINSKDHQGGGDFTEKCSKWLRENHGAKEALLTTSCTSAMEMFALLLAEKRPGCEVILPSYTFCTTASAFLRAGLTPVFIDIRSDTQNIDEILISSAINEKTGAICVVHYAGVAAEMDAVLDIARRHELYVLEDAAQGINATYKGQYLGSIGDLGAISFHATKNISSGEGGALIVNNPDFFESAHMIWEKGTNRKQFIEGQVDKYTWHKIGSSFLPSELNAAFLYAQLESIQEVTDRRLAIWEIYNTELKALSECGKIKLPSVPTDCKHNAHMFYILLESPEVNARLRQYLSDKDISAHTHYVPLHSSPAGKEYCKTFETLAVTDQTSATILRLPLYYQMTTEEAKYVAETINDFFK